MERPILFSPCAKKSQTNNTIVDSNAGHLNNRPIHVMVLLLLPSVGNRNYTGWLTDWLHWLPLTAVICNCCSLQWLLLSAMAAASGNSGYTGVVVEVLDLLLVFQLKYVKLQIVPNCTNKCSVISI